MVDKGPPARLSDRLAGGSRRSLGEADAVAAEARGSRRLVDELVDCLLVEDELVRMRAADALEKVARDRPEWVAPHVDRLLGEVAEVEQPSVRWHVAQLLAEVPLDPSQRERAVVLLRRMLEEETDWIVLTCAMSAMTDLALAGSAPDTVAPWLVAVLRRHARDPRPAVAKRATRQLARMGGRAR